MTSESKVGARCVSSARRDLRGGQSERAVPTATAVCVGYPPRSLKLTWSDALRLSFGIDAELCACGTRRRLIAVITQATVIKKTLVHMGLPTDVGIQETQPVWRVRGPPEELFPEGIDDTGQDLDVAVDEEFGVDFVDDLPADDEAA